MRFRHLALAGLLIHAGLAPRHALAAEPPPSSTQRFDELTAQAEQAFDRKEYQRAIDIYLESYAVIPSPDVLYNVAFIYETHLGSAQLARDFYSRVIRDPSSRPDLVRLSTERVAGIDAAAARATVKPRVLAEPTPGGTTPGVQKTLAPEEASSSPTPWILIGVGGASVAAGLVFGYMAQDSHSQFESGIGGLEHSREEKDLGETRALVADVLWISGAALTLTGIVLAVTADSPPERGALRMSPSLSPDGAGLVVGGAF